MTVIIWFRKDLRLSDNPALQAAIKSGGEPIIPIYILSEQANSPWKMGSASRVWLHHSLNQLNHDLKELGSRLILQKGDPAKILRHLISEQGISYVFFQRDYEPVAMKEEKEVIEMLEQLCCPFEIFQSGVLLDPTEILNKSGRPFQKFTPFWNACLQQEFQLQLSPRPRILPKVPHSIVSLGLNDLKLLPKMDWAEEITAFWQPGEKGAKRRLEQFMKNALHHYKKMRDFPDQAGTSFLSPHLHFGEISPHRIYAEVYEREKEKKGFFLRELIWRDFAYYLMAHFPKYASHSFYEQFDEFPWEKNAKNLKKWQKGLTGYPIVDAGMRQLWKFGWMHNRVRMIVASFLVKDLLLPWQFGARWFWDTLVDADLASNTLNWQWVAGCGPDAAGFYRIFNPITQALKFDPEGTYVRAYIPELRNLPTKWIHCPWQAPQEVLKESQIVLGKTYPLPMIDHEEARNRALKIYRQWKSKK